MRIRKFKDYNQYYSITRAGYWSFDRYMTYIYVKRIKPKTNAIILNCDGTERILASGLKGINKYLKLHPDDEIEI